MKWILIIAFLLSFFFTQEKIFAQESENYIGSSLLDTIKQAAENGDRIAKIFLNEEYILPKNLLSNICAVDRNPLLLESEPVSFNGYFFLKEKVENNKVTEKCINPAIGLIYEIQYNDNGLVVQKGFSLINKPELKIGDWSYYSAKGQKDSIINYEINRQVCFSDFFEIADNFGLIGTQHLIVNPVLFNRKCDSLDIIYRKSELESNSNDWFVAYSEIPAFEAEDLNDSFGVTFRTYFGYRKINEAWYSIKEFRRGQNIYSFEFTFHGTENRISKSCLDHYLHIEHLILPK